MLQVTLSFPRYYVHRGILLYRLRYAQTQTRPLTRTYNSPRAHTRTLPYVKRIRYQTLSETAKNSPDFFRPTVDNSETPGYNSVMVNETETQTQPYRYFLTRAPKDYDYSGTARYTDLTPGTSLVAIPTHAADHQVNRYASGNYGVTEVAPGSPEAEGYAYRRVYRTVLTEGLVIEYDVTELSNDDIDSQFSVDLTVSANKSITVGYEWFQPNQPQPQPQD